MSGRSNASESPNFNSRRNNASAVGWASGGPGYSSGATPSVSTGSGADFGTPLFLAPGANLFGVQLNASNATDRFTVNGAPPQGLFNYEGLTGLPIGLAITGAPAGPLRQVERTYWIREEPRSEVAVASVAAYPPVSVSVAAEPQPGQVGQPLWLRATVAPDLPGTELNVTGLPSGCSWGNASVLECTPRAAGTFDLTASARFAFGLAVANATTIRIDGPGPATLDVAVSDLTGNVTLGGSFTLRTTVVGGLPPYRISYDGLPPGCTSQNVTELTCLPTAWGTFAITVRALDPLGRSGNATVNETVSTGPAGPLSLTGAELLALGLGTGGLGGAAAMYTAMRRRRGPPSSDA